MNRQTKNYVDRLSGVPKSKWREVRDRREIGSLAFDPHFPADVHWMTIIIKRHLAVRICRLGNVATIGFSTFIPPE